VHLPDAADNSHITASLDDLGANRRQEGRHFPLAAGLRIPAPSITPADAL